MEMKVYKVKKYNLPNINLLNINTNLQLNFNDKKELLISAKKLEKILSSFGIQIKSVEIIKGPLITRFELQHLNYTNIAKIISLKKDIAFAIGVKDIAIESFFEENKALVVVDVPNKTRIPIFFREVLESIELKKSNYEIAWALGKDMTGRSVVVDLNKIIHILIGATMEKEKNICIDTFIVSVLYNYSPEDIKLLLIDLRIINFNIYNAIPHLLIPIITENKKAIAALKWAIDEVNRRYKLFNNVGVKNINSYNELVKKGLIDEKLSRIVIIINELADLVRVDQEKIEKLICNLAQKGGCVGVHLIIGTQVLSPNIITRLIKDSIPSKISFITSNEYNSKVILDLIGAEKLLGKGDMLFYPLSELKPKRVQGAFISDEEIKNIVLFIKSAQVTGKEYEVLQHINPVNNNLNNKRKTDELLNEAIKIVIETGQVSTSYLQRRLRIGFNRAARIVDELEKNRVISARDGNKPRQVLISKEKLNRSVR